MNIQTIPTAIIEQALARAEHLDLQPCGPNLATLDELGRMRAWAWVRDLAIQAKEEDEAAERAALDADRIASLRRTWASLNEADASYVSLRAVKALDAAKLFRVIDVVGKTDAEMLRVKNFGRKSLNEVKDELSSIYPLSDAEIAAAREP